MNQPLPSDPSQNQFQTPQQPQAQPQTTSQAQMPPTSSPFEQPVQVSQVPPASQPLTTPPVGVQQSGFQPNEMQPAPSGLKSSKWLIIGLVVILFIGVLVFASWQGWINLGSISNLWKKSEPAVVVPVVEDKTNANDKLRKADLANLKAALKSYYQANQTYPIAATIEKTSDTVNALTVLVPTYIAVLPLDPLSPTYYYGYKSDGKTFELTCLLEDKTDTAGTLSGTNSIYKITDASVETPAASTNTGTTVISPDASTSDTTSSDTTSTDANSSSGSATGSSSSSSSATTGQ